MSSTLREDPSTQQCPEASGCVPSNPPWQTVAVDDDELLAKAEETLTEIKVNQGLSERHEAVLAALRIRLKGSAGKSLEEMLAAADDPTPDRLGDAIAKAEGERKPSLDDLLGKQPKKPEWPS
jgi:Arc/MetJ family transcription regulator